MLVSFSETSYERPLYPSPSFLGEGDAKKSDMDRFLSKGGSRRFSLSSFRSTFGLVVNESAIEDIEKTKHSKVKLSQQA
jgi:hypothetical protein